jgi:hypothetical protein
VDSATWVQAAAFGEIILHPHGRIIVSEKSGAKHVDGKHILTLSPAEKEHVLDLIAKKGYNVDNLTFSLPYHRAAFNMNALMEIKNELNSRQDFTFKSPSIGLF